ncbi:MAG: SRPBCC family protein [Acidobacteria bacterium]|nr:SRPBCC family protein [Acidobacteriota bacterium]
MKIYSLERTQELPISLAQGWEFFSNPSNLKEITPAWLELKVTSNVPEKIYSGLFISYNVKPFLGITMSWVTEILDVKEPYFFVDEQKLGPYSFWRHQHIFKEISNAIEVRDIVHYSLPLGILGDIVHKAFIRNQLKQIFDFRHQVLSEKF